MPWFKVDDKLHDHRKTRLASSLDNNRRDLAAMGLWLVAGSWCADNRTDGFVPARELRRWDSRGRRLADRLVSAGYWYVDRQDGEDGFRFHDWSKYQPTRMKLAEESERKAKAGRAGGLASGRSRREADSQAEQEAEAKQAASRLLAKQTNPRTRTPKPPTANGSSQLTPAQLAEIRDLTNGDIAHAHKTAKFILERAPDDVRSPHRYVLAAIKADPEPYRYRRGHPTLKQSCPEHPGEWADGCRSCSLDHAMSGDE